MGKLLLDGDHSFYNDVVDLLFHGVYIEAVLLQPIENLGDCSFVGLGVFN